MQAHKKEGVLLSCYFLWSQLLTPWLPQAGSLSVCPPACQSVCLFWMGSIDIYNFDLAFYDRIPRKEKQKT